MLKWNLSCWSKTTCPYRITSFLRHVATSPANGADLYKILKVKPGANQKEIKSAYYDLCKEYHPDKNKNSDANRDKFNQIAEAYEILSDEQKRKDYDRSRGMGRGFTYTPPPNASSYHSPFRPEDIRQHEFRQRPGTGRGYNADEWYRRHYGDREQRLKRLREMQEERERLFGHRGRRKRSFLLNPAFNVFLLFLFMSLMTGPPR